MPSEGPRHANHVWDFSHFCAKIFNKSNLREEKIYFCLISDHRGVENTESSMAVAVSGEGACFCWATSISQAPFPKGSITSCNQGHHPGTKCSNTWTHCVCGGGTSQIQTTLINQSLQWNDQSVHWRVLDWCPHPKLAQFNASCIVKVFDSDSSKVREGQETLSKGPEDWVFWN